MFYLSSDQNFKLLESLSLWTKLTQKLLSVMFLLKDFYGARSV